MPEIIIKALTDKGREILSIQGKQSPMGAMALKMIGLKEKVICKEPYTVRVSFNNIPEAVLDQIELALKVKFEKLGGKLGEDFSLNIK